MGRFSKADIDIWVAELVQIFGVRNPDVVLGLSVRDEVYYFTLDFSFTQLDESTRKKAQKDINSMLRAIQDAGIKSELRLGEV